jgi:hypothetical protein
MIRTTLDHQEQFLARRTAELGYTGRDYVPANSGANRTESKRALLRAIAQTAADRNEAPRFAANIGAD